MEPLINNLDFLKAFLGGVAVSFTPCVYPLIPVSAGFIAANASGSRIKGFILSLIYVTGIALTYSVLGLFASLTGTLFGRISSHPVTYIIVGAVIVFFGLSMAGLFHLNPPQLIRAPKHREGSYLSMLVLGIFSGLIVSPCLTPVLGTILLYLATKKSLVYGVSLLFSFAYGMGLILILAGMFSGILAGMPRAGKWMGHVKKAGAAILLFTGLYFIFTGIRRF